LEENIVQVKAYLPYEKPFLNMSHILESVAKHCADVSNVQCKTSRTCNHLPPLKHDSLLLCKLHDVTVYFA